MTESGEIATIFILFYAIQFCYKSNYVTNGFLIMIRIFST